MCLFNRCNGLFRCPETGAGPGSNLGKYQDFLMPGYNIDFTVLAVEISLDDLVSMLFQILLRQLFAEITGLFPFHSSRSLTGANDLLCTGEGPRFFRQRTCSLVP